MTYYIYIRLMKTFNDDNRCYAIVKLNSLFDQNITSMIICTHAMHSLHGNINLCIYSHRNLDLQMWL